MKKRKERLRYLGEPSFTYAETFGNVVRGFVFKNR